MGDELSRRRFLEVAGAGISASALPSLTSAAEGDTRPNIIFIMADDLGAECLGCYGGQDYDTPRLDGLARTGLQFDNAYCTPLCTPTRVEVMTGQYPCHNGWPAGIWTKPREKQFLDPDMFNFAHLLQNAGYATAVAGKWQLARFEDRPHHARNIGFDEHCLWTWLYSKAPDSIRMEGRNKPSRFWGPGMWRNGSLMEDTKGKFGPDICADFLIDFIEKHRSDPFFVYYPMNLTHWPFVPVPGMEGDKDGTRKGKTAKRNFGAMVEYTDMIVGRIADKLDDLGIRENTLLIFTGDNGTAKDIRSKYKGSMLRGGKHDLTDAGARVPFIVDWPGQTPQGEVVDDLIDFSDMLPTFADASGASIPPDHKVDGRSILPQIRGRKGKPRDWVFCQRGGGWFLRSKNWRLRSNGQFVRMAGHYSPKEVDTEKNAEAARAKKRLQKVARSLGVM